MGTALIIGAILAAGGYAEARMIDSFNTEEVYEDTYRKMVDNNLDGLSMHQIVGDMYNQGLLSPDEFKKAGTILKEYDNEFIGNKTGWTDFWNRFKHQLGTNKEARNLFSKVAEQIPAYLNRDQTKSVNDILSGFYQAVPNIADAPAPTYLDVDNVVAPMKDVEPVHLYTGQEMADLHNLDYNPNNYYDLIKQGTTANLDAARFASQQMNEASMVGDTATENDYLNAIRNIKAQSISDGATAGARAANELLAMTEKDNAYAQNQAQVAQDRFNAIDQYLQEDAQAKLAARQQFENLAKSLSTDAATLYATDSDKFGQEWLTNAEKYSSDMNLLGNRMAANLNMAGAYAQAQAQINATRSAVNKEADEFAWVFNRFLERNGYNEPNNTQAQNDKAFYTARAQMNDYLGSRYTGYPTNYDYYSNVYYKNQ